jgi:hypothetical protein
MTIPPRQLRVFRSGLLAPQEGVTHVVCVNVGPRNGPFWIDA